MPETTAEEDRLRAWFQVILNSNDPHAAACARHALAGDPAPERKTGFSSDRGME